MAETSENAPLDQAVQHIEDVKNLAQITGVQRHNVESSTMAVGLNGGFTHTEPYDKTDFDRLEKAEDTGGEEVAIAPAVFNHSADQRVLHYGALVSPKAAITKDGLKDSGYESVKSRAGDITYTAHISGNSASAWRPAEPGELAMSPVVERPDGKGGTRKIEIRNPNTAERMSELIARRANRDLKKAITARTRRIADELEGTK